MSYITTRKYFSTPFRILYAATLCCLLPQISQAQLVLHGNQSAAVLANTLVGAGITISAPTLTCYGAANATFTTGAVSPLGIPNGIVLTTGAAVDTTTPLSFGPVYGVGNPSSDFASAGWGLPGDPALTAAAGGEPTNDACILEFDLAPAGDTIKFNYVFGSEEYTDFACSEFNDVFAFFITGGAYTTATNIALVPGTSIPVCINSVNCGGTGGSPTSPGCTSLGAGSPFCAYYINNTSTTSAAAPYVVYDGLTTVLQAVAAVNPCTTYHLKLAIADGTDDVYDSGVFIEGGSLTSTGISVSPVGINPLDTGFSSQYCVRECTPGEFVFHATGNLADTSVVHFTIGGTAVNGYDYTTIADSAIIPAGDSTDTVFIYGLTVPPAGPKTVELYVYSSFTCGGAPVIIDSAELTIYDSLYVHIITPDTTVCIGQSVVINDSGSSSLVYSWSPAATLNNSTLQSPTATPTGTTTYTVTANYPGSGCAPSTDHITITTTTEGPAPVISGPSPVCQNSTPVPFTVTGVSPGGTVNWYYTGSGSTPLSTPPTVNTSVPGTTTYWANQGATGCASGYDTITIQVISTPPAPTVSGTMVYCQYAGPFVPLTVTGIAGGTISWYTAPGGYASATEPPVDISDAGTYTYYVSQADSACPSPKTMVTITVNPKPATPSVTPFVYCQYLSSAPLTPSGAGLTWYGPGIAATGTAAPPAPPTGTAVADSYYVTQTITAAGLSCTGDSAIVPVTILPQPAPPVTSPVTYCQFSPSLPLTAIGANLQWYTGGVLTDSVPVPPTGVAGDNTWYVTQSITTLGVTCQSDSASLGVTVIALPVFTIAPSSPFVCQFDSITLSFTSSSSLALINPGYSWVLPQGASVANGSTITGMPSISVKFDSASQNNYVSLTASDDSGLCSTTDTIRIKVVAQPSAIPYSAPNVCPGDTVLLALAGESDDAFSYVWLVDGAPLAASSAVSIIASNSNSGGPFSVSWADSGIHVIQLNTATEEGCASPASYDTVNVRPLPNASFIYRTKTGVPCLYGEMLFSVTDSVYNNAYTWGPAYSFKNINTPSAWGTLQESPSIITLTVTDPFGCAATSSMTLDPGSCCTVSFPNAFSPNNDGLNDYFRPIFPDSGYHNFHVFSIANRWGQIVFQTSSSDGKWDGTFNGVPQDMGIYYYYIKFDCGGGTTEQKGEVTLIR